jgi:glutathione S-transferase
MPLLYYRAPVGHSAKTLITLAEKGISFQSRLIEPPALEPHAATIRSISPSGSLPVFVDDDGTGLAESSAIGEYLDETRPTFRLMPEDPIGRWRARVWFKVVNEDLAPAVAILAWSAWRVPTLGSDEREYLTAAAEAIPALDRRRYWQEGLAGFTPSRLEAAQAKVRGVINLVEKQLTQSAYLAGSRYSLADIDVWPFMEPLPRLLPDIVGETFTPHLTAWTERIAARPAVIAATRGARDSDWVLGPEPIRWG